jgi:surface protein
MEAMFNEAAAFNQDLSAWNVSQVTDMSSLFNNAEAFNQDISNWVTSSVISMSAMFLQAISFNQNLTSWDVSNCLEMDGMFSGAEKFNQSLCNWGVQFKPAVSVPSVNCMFCYSGCPNTSSPNASIPVEGPWCWECPFLRESSH